MANICWFEMRVRGTKENCQEMFDSDIPCYDAYIDEEQGTDEDYMMYIKGECRWSVYGSMVNVDEDETHRLLVIYTRSVCFNVLKKRNKIDFLSVSNACHDDEGHITDIELPDDVDILEELVKKETRKHLAAAIESLGEPTSLIVNLKYYHDMKNKDIAEMLEMNASTVSTILQRSMGILRKRLEEYMNGKDQ